MSISNYRCSVPNDVKKSIYNDLSRYFADESCNLLGYTFNIDEEGIDVELHFS